MTAAPAHGQKPAGDWLIVGHRALCDGLGQFLDPEAGLCEITVLHAGHANLLGALSSLDTQAGLTAILPSQATETPGREAAVIAANAAQEAEACRDDRPRSVSKRFRLVVGSRLVAAALVVFVILGPWLFGVSSLHSKQPAANSTALIYRQPCFPGGLGPGSTGVGAAAVPHQAALTLGATTCAGSGAAHQPSGPADTR